MDFVLRLLIGLVILAVLSAIWMFLFNLLAAVINGIAFFFAKLIRRMFGIHGTWGRGTTVALLGVQIFKLLAVGLFWISVIWYALFVPRGQFIADGAAALAGVTLMMLWMPSVFLWALFSEHDA